MARITFHHLLGHLTIQQGSMWLQFKNTSVNLIEFYMACKIQCIYRKETSQMWLKFEYAY